MKKSTFYTLLFLLLSSTLFAQSIDDKLSQKKMMKDLETFRSIRETVNSGLYTYRTKEQIDSTYNWAFKEIQHLNSYRDFFNLLETLTDYEGSLHNWTSWPSKLSESYKSETTGYFPIPIKIIEGKLLVNKVGEVLPLGAEIISVNSISADQMLQEFAKHYTTDGYNTSAKKIGISHHFSRYFRFNFGMNDDFEIVYNTANSEENQKTTVKSVGYKEYYKRFENRHSAKVDHRLFDDLEEDEYYSFEKINASTAILSVNNFGLGSGKDKSYLKYKSFLDSVFTLLKEEKIENLIVDVANNGGGDKPNDMLTLSYLANTPQKEIDTAWIGFTDGVPYWKYFVTDYPFYLRPIVKSKYNKFIKQTLPIIKDNRRYYEDIEIYEPKENSFQGQIYLLVGPAVASSASLFASMVASNTNAIVVGEETNGGYYEHNGSFPLKYKLPKSNFSTTFSIVNLTQNVKQKANQPFGRGVMPDHNVEQTFDDFMNNKDTQMEFLLELISRSK